MKPSEEDPESRANAKKKSNEAALEIIDDVLFTDYHSVIRKEERGNAHQIGLVGRLNSIYFDQYLKPEWDIKEGYKGEFEKIKLEFQARIASINLEQRSRINQCKTVLRK